MSLFSRRPPKPEQPQRAPLAEVMLQLRLEDIEKRIKALEQMCLNKPKEQK